MDIIEGYWVNVDNRGYKCILHKMDCSKIPDDIIAREQTGYKGIEYLTFYGGWFSFLTIEETVDFIQ